MEVSIGSRLELLPAAAFVKERLRLFDVRSPSEYAHAHIPSSINLPLFSDDERAAVGTIYKQKSRQEAIELGVQLAGPKLWHLLEQVKAHAVSRIGLYCWRGGMRSGFLSWFLSFVGYEVYTLQGGYKAYRRYVLGQLQNSFVLKVVGGFTGSGKTEFLHALRAKGEQVIDLEALACHRGSAYGETALKQPSNEQFENLLAEELFRLDPNQPVWVEDESRLIGCCKIPDAFFSAMKKAPRIILEVPKEERIARILREYAHHPPEWWKRCTKKIASRLGAARMQAVLVFIDEGRLADAIAILLEYYDTAYEHSMVKYG